MNILFIFLFPLIGASIILLTKKSGGYISLLVSVLSFLSFLTVYQEISAEHTIDISPANIFDLHIIVDRMNFVILSVVLFLHMMIILYSLNWVRKHSTRYYSLLLLTMGFTMGCFLSGDLLTYYIFFEMTTLFSFFLVMHKGTERARRTGFMYLIVCFAGGGLLLISLVWVYVHNGSFGFHYLQGISVLLFIIGCVVKAGAFPLHFWLPEAHPIAPSPVSALLSGITIKIGVYGLIRLFMVQEAIYWMETIAVLSMLFGVILALVQTDVKRMLAYSSISQVGYMLLGVSLSSLGIAGGIFHMINHALFKGLLFLCMGTVIYSTGERRIGKLGGLYKKMPYTMISCIIASLAIAGMPLFNGFASKTVIFGAIPDTSLKITFIFVCAGTFTLICKLNKHVFFGELPDNLKKTEEVPLLMVISMIVLSIACILIGVFPNFIFENLYAGGFDFWSLSHLLEGALSIFLGAVIFIFGEKMGLFRIKEHDTGKIYNEIIHLADIICKNLNKIVSRDINIYILCILLFFIILFFL